MSSSKPPEVAIGKVDGLWTVAIACWPLGGNNMRLGKRTERLVREAIVLGHVEGARWAGWYAGRPGDEPTYPRDSTVVDHVLLAAKSFRDLYPTLSKIESGEAS